MRRVGVFLDRLGTKFFVDLIEIYTIAGYEILKKIHLK
jgi:hypothetical protein